MTCTIHTACINSRDPDALDITVKSAATPEGRALAPEWEMVNGVKGGCLTEAQYRENYLALLRKRFAADSSPFLEILSRPRVVLTCYCAAGDFCHRLIASEVLAKIGTSRGIEVILAGEIVPDTKQMSMFDEPTRRYE